MFGLNHEETFKEAKRGGWDGSIAYFQRNRNSLSAEGLSRALAPDRLKSPEEQPHHAVNQKYVFV